MQIPKLKVLVEAGAVRAVDVSYATEAGGWVVAITYASRRGDGLLAAQRRQVAHHAGGHWRPLLDYLSGQLRQLPEG
jgi:hypothetical protein